MVDSKPVSMPGKCAEDRALAEDRIQQIEAVAHLMMVESMKAGNAGSSRKG